MYVRSDQLTADDFFLLLLSLWLLSLWLLSLSLLSLLSSSYAVVWGFAIKFFLGHLPNLSVFSWRAWVAFSAILKHSLETHPGAREAYKRMSRPIPHKDPEPCFCRRKNRGSNLDTLAVEPAQVELMITRSEVFPPIFAF